MYGDAKVAFGPGSSGYEYNYSNCKKSMAHVVITIGLHPPM